MAQGRAARAPVAASNGVTVAVVDQGGLASGELSKADWSSEEWEAFRNR